MDYEKLSGDRVSESSKSPEIFSKPDSRIPNHQILSAMRYARRGDKTILQLAAGRHTERVEVSEFDAGGDIVAVQ